MTKSSITLGRLAALSVGLMAALTGVAQAAPPPHASLAATNTSGANTAAPPTSQAIIGGTNYHITVHTGNVTNGGTDGGVEVKLYGTKNNSPTVSPWVILNNAEDNFEKNKYDVFDRRLADLGTLKKLCVRFTRGSGTYAAGTWTGSTSTARSSRSTTIGSGAMSPAIPEFRSSLGRVGVVNWR